MEAQYVVVGTDGNYLCNPELVTFSKDAGRAHRFESESAAVQECSRLNDDLGTFLPDVKLRFEVRAVPKPAPLSIHRKRFRKHQRVLVRGRKAVVTGHYKDRAPLAQFQYVGEPPNPDNIIITHFADGELNPLITEDLSW